MSCSCSELFFWPGIVEIARSAKIGPEGGVGGAMEALLDCRSGSDAVGEGKGMIAELYGSLKEHNLVDEVLKKECTVEAGTGFEEDAEDLSLREFCEDRRESEMACVIGDDLDFDTVFAKLVDLFGRSGGAGDQEQVAVDGAKKLRGVGDAKVSIKHDAEEGPASRSVSAVGQEGIVGEHGAYAGEDGVGGVAKLLNFIACRGAGKPMRLIGQAR